MRKGANDHDSLSERRLVFDAACRRRVCAKSSITCRLPDRFGAGQTLIDGQDVRTAVTTRVARDNQEMT